MHKLLLPIIAVVSLFLNFLLLFRPWSGLISLNPSLRTAKVARVLDGDTFDIANGERIRLFAIDAPEFPKGCLGVDAKNRLVELLLNKQIKFDQINKDHFGRTVALVYFNKLLINEVLVEEGLAYFGASKTLAPASLTIEQAQTKAKTAARGVWSNQCQNTQKPGCLIKGNYRSDNHTRIYHLPNCYNYRRISIKPGTSDQWFCTEQEALSTGFTKSQDCPN